jgi:hypothetical protein
VRKWFQSLLFKCNLYRYAKALDPTQDVILAYAQNGETLRPDHGYPVRVIIPGYIGGRMIKWLCKIEVGPLYTLNAVDHTWLETARFQPLEAYKVKKTRFQKMLFTNGSQLVPLRRGHRRAVSKLLPLPR